jgi:hypothetical protein
MPLFIIHLVIKWLEDPAILNKILSFYFSQMGLFFAFAFLKPRVSPAVNGNIRASDGSSPSIFCKGPCPSSSSVSYKDKDEYDTDDEEGHGPLQKMEGLEPSDALIFPLTAI